MFGLLLNPAAAPAIATAYAVSEVHEAPRRLDNMVDRSLDKEESIKFKLSDLEKERQILKHQQSKAIEYMTTLESELTKITEQFENLNIECTELKKDLKDRIQKRNKELNDWFKWLKPEYYAREAALKEKKKKLAEAKAAEAAAKAEAAPAAESNPDFQPRLSTFSERSDLAEEVSESDD